MIKRCLYLGRVEAFGGENKGNHIAYVRPFYESVESQPWTEFLFQESQLTFPPRGLIAWKRAPSNATKGTIWVFDVEHYINTPLEYYSIKFNIKSEPSSPVEIIDLRSAKFREGFRALLNAVEGIELSFIPSQCVYLWIDTHRWVGPVSLEKKEKNLWRLILEEKDHFLPVVLPASGEYLVSLKIDGHRRFLVPGIQANKPIGYIKCTYLNNVLNFVQENAETDRSLTDKNALVATGRETSVATISSDALLSEQQRELVDTLLSMPSIVASIDEVKQSARKETEDPVYAELVDMNRRVYAEIEAERVRGQKIKEEVRSKTQELERIEQDIQKRQQELNAIQQEIEAQKAAQASQVDVLDHALSKRLLDVVARPEQFLADVAIIRAALNLSTSSQLLQEPTSSSVSAHNGHTKVEPSQQTRHTFSWISSPDKQLLSTQDSVRRALRTTFGDQGLSSSIAFCLHATFLAGAIPVVLGGDAFDILKTYALCITEGRLLWIPIAPTMLEPTDLLGKVDTVSRCFIPHQNLLLDLLLEAPAHPDELYMVVLDGVNRAAIDAYLMPILACYRDRWQDEGKRSLSLFHPHAIAADDPYAPASQLEWPQNVLLAGTLTEGVTVIAPPASLWNYATLVCPHIKEFQVSLEQRARGQTSSTDRHLSSVSMNMWRTWYGDVSKNSNASPIDLLEKLDDEGFILCAEGQKLYDRLYTAVMQQRDKDTASNLLLFQSILPQALSSHQEVALRQALVPQSAASMDTAIEMVREVLM